MITTPLTLIQPQWPAPKHIIAGTTTRKGGVSQGSYADLNLATHVGDDRRCVEQNRTRLKDSLNLPSEPSWMQQTHSTTVLTIDAHYSLQEGDACYTRETNLVCAVLTADCLPLLVCNRQGTEVAAIHAGWKGLAAGVIEACINKFTSAPSDVMVWLGPALGPQAFEARADLHQLFCEFDAEAEHCFIKKNADTWIFNIYRQARQRLKKLGITEIYGADHCTYTEKEKFFSYRRDPNTGRMASLIYIKT